ncbi:MAG: rRNA maturation RNase YbeY [Candidatus Zambryskibacteria bacterium RIFOXYD1_FULL_40_13]|nr:MAG: putative rRNA maturation factor [Parcubacteria group bacterium GW2011_GWC1_39_12]KKR19531.1 MAG: putative rRNA maturation factor [Parcubacteria group bacterium GW2011_GWF1_39_37]KKR35684.1 MAG: putative rRNA maturation factor [Parcubacteria group bacterium GW2011_GWC2_40_10]KKR52499.1 MAG: putative rRNA maturation factor [Parcubacteria group bacterium GW2011_GWE1_40_20]KKR65492.1 MAG: putative rRNA maturation factor [Parcubacteria group bacterium GW2011_GWB1_40_5]KKR68947.1 MAG: putati
MTDNNFTITNKTKNTLPSVSFALMKDVVLGKKYSLSLVFVGNKKSQELNNSYRGKNKPTNILSFPLDKTTGEIFINLSLAKKESPRFDRKPTNFVAFLFIHGLMHLKGMRHGSRMDRLEAKFQKQFGI